MMLRNANTAQMEKDLLERLRFMLWPFGWEIKSFDWRQDPWDRCLRLQFSLDVAGEVMKIEHAVSEYLFESRIPIEHLSRDIAHQIVGKAMKHFEEAKLDPPKQRRPRSLYATYDEFFSRAFDPPKAQQGPPPPPPPPKPQILPPLIPKATSPGWTAPDLGMWLDLCTPEERTLFGNEQHAIRQYLETLGKEMGVNVGIA